MKIYAVGGAVRDRLLGLPVKDRDYVVVGATPAQMLERGFKPVGKDFPVFLHPETHEEYALARTERKIAPGYTGFVFSTDAGITLEDDLARRDLTINAVAQDENGTLIDPFGGLSDIKAKVLRHVGPAFAEDPLRVLRVARFSARYGDFSIAPQTLELMRHMVDNGEVDHLVPERVWQELARGLMERHPSRLIRVLRECGALGRLIPELDALFGIPQPADHHPEIDTGAHILLALEAAADAEAPLPVRYAVLLHDLGKGETPAEILPRHLGHEERGVEIAEAVSQRLKAPKECRDLAHLATRFHGKIHRADEIRIGTLVQLLEECDALRRPERFHALLEACACDYRGRLGKTDNPYPQAERLRLALHAARTIDAAAIVASVDDPKTIPARLHEARVHAVKSAFAALGNT